MDIRAFFGIMGYKWGRSGQVLMGSGVTSSLNEVAEATAIFWRVNYDLFGKSGLVDGFF